jgi:hypothetical protein
MDGSRSPGAMEIRSLSIMFRDYLFFICVSSVAIIGDSALKTTGRPAGDQPFCS